MINSCIGGRKRRRLVWIGVLLGNLRVGGRVCVMSALRPKSHLPTMCRGRHRNFDSGHFLLVFLACEEESGRLGTGQLTDRGWKLAEAMDRQKWLGANCRDWHGRSCARHWHSRME